MKDPIEEIKKIYKTDLPKALDIFKKSIELAEKSNDKITLANILGENAILNYLDNKFSNVFESLYKSLNILFDIKTSNKEEYINTIVKLDNVSKFVLTILTTGKPPENTNQNLTELNPGYFIDISINNSKFYNDFIEPSILIQLMIFAENIGKDNEAGKLALKAYSVSNENPINLMRIGNNIIPYLIHNNMYKEAINTCLKTSLFLFSIRINQNSLMFQKEEEFIDLIKKQSKDLLEELSQNAVYFSLIPIMFHLSKNYLVSPENINSYIDEIQEACKNVSKEIYVTSTWEVASNIIRSTFEEKYSFQEFIDLSEKHSKEGQRALQHLCYLASVLQKKVTPQNMIYIHILIFIETASSFFSFPFLYRKVIIPFFKVYWEKKFNNNRFRFKNPSYVEQELILALNSPYNKTVQKILYTMANGLGIELEEEYKKVLTTN